MTLASRSHAWPRALLVGAVALGTLAAGGGRAHAQALVGYEWSFDGANGWQVALARANQQQGQSLILARPGTLQNPLPLSAEDRFMVPGASSFCVGPRDAAAVVCLTPDIYMQTLGMQELEIVSNAPPGSYDNVDRLTQSLAAMRAVLDISAAQCPAPGPRNCFIPYTVLQATLTREPYNLAVAWAPVNDDDRKTGIYLRRPAPVGAEGHRVEVPVRLEAPVQVNMDVLMSRLADGDRRAHLLEARYPTNIYNAAVGWPEIDVRTDPVLSPTERGVVGLFWHVVGNKAYILRHPPGVALAALERKNNYDAFPKGKLGLVLDSLTAGQRARVALYFANDLSQELCENALDAAEVVGAEDDGQEIRLPAAGGAPSIANACTQQTTAVRNAILAGDGSAIRAGDPVAPPKPIPPRTLGEGVNRDVSIVMELRQAQAINQMARLTYTVAGAVLSNRPGLQAALNAFYQ